MLNISIYTYFFKLQCAFGVPLLATEEFFAPENGVAWAAAVHLDGMADTKQQRCRLAPARYSNKAGGGEVIEMAQAESWGKNFAGP